MIFVDTGVWFARFVPKDPDHHHVLAWFADNDEPLVTSDYCVDETLTLLMTRARPNLAIEAGRELFEQTIARLCFSTLIKSIGLGFCFSNDVPQDGASPIAQARS